MAHETPLTDETRAAVNGGRRRAVIVVGMHRSGTSALSRVLGLRGLELPATPMGANSANRLGHWGESAPIYELHEELLRSVGVSWDGLEGFPAAWFGSPQAAQMRDRMAALVRSEFPGEGTFVLKDPRICVLIPLWREVLAKAEIEPAFVLPVRNPLEVAASLAARDGLPHSHGMLLWLHLTLEAERQTRAARRVLVSCDALLREWRPVVERIETELAAGPLGDAAGDEEIDDYLSAGERHHHYSAEDLARRGDVADWVAEAYHLLDAATQPGAGADVAALDRISEQLAVAGRAYGPILQATADAAHQGEPEREAADRLAAHEAANAELAARVAALEAELAARSADLDQDIARARPQRGGKPQMRLSGPPSNPTAISVARGSRIRGVRQLASWARSPVRGRKRIREFLLIRNSPEFDREFYLRRNPDVANAGMNPVVHYIDHGARAGLDPSPTFSTSGYLRAHPDIAKSEVNPLYAYLRAKRQSRPPGDGTAGDDDGSDPPRPHPAVSRRLSGDSPVALDLSQEVRTRARIALELNPLSVSVVVPTYNRSEPLREALDSAFAQTYPPLEVLVCDDGGDDKTAEMLEREFGTQLAAGTLRLLHHDRRRGSSAARNTALAEARGKLIAYLDSDNRWQPDLLLILAGRMAEGDDIASAHCGVLMHDDSGEPREVFDRFDREQLLTRNYIDLNAFIHRRRVYEQLGGFDEELSRLVDWDLLLRYTRNYPPASVPHCLVDYYAGRRGDRISHTEDFDVNAEQIRRRVALERLQSGVTPLRLAYVLWDYPALSQTFVLSEIEQLLGDGHDVNVYFHQAPDLAAEPAFSVPSFQVDDPAQLADLLREHGRTLVHSHFAYPHANRLAWPAARVAGVPFTFTVHAVDIFHRANRERNQIAEMAADELCARVFAIGEFHRDFLIERGVDPAKISIARPAARLVPAPTELTDQRIARRRRVVGCVTRFVEKKGVDDLIRAAAELGEETEIRLHGYGPQEDELRRLADQLGVGTVRFLGPLERDGLAAALAEIDVFALPCVIDANDDMDGLPTVIGEAMAAGVPVVTTAISAIGEVVRDGITGFVVEPRSPEQLGRKLREVLEMPAERLRPVIEAAAEAAAATWNPQRTTEVLLDSWQRPPLEIAMVTHSRFEDHGAETTAEIIRRVHRMTCTPFRLRIVDNDSDSDFRERLAAAIAAAPDASLTLLDRNLQWGPGLNLALREARSDQLVYVCSNEGFVLRCGWERRMIEFMRSSRNVAIAGHRVSSPGFPTAGDYPAQPWFAGFRNKWFADRDPAREMTHVQGGIFVLRRDAYERCGGFSERTAQAAADVEYSHYVESLGWELGEIDAIPSLTKKTRPTLDAHLDENTLAAHPLGLDSVEAASRVACGKQRYCNVCAWQGEDFGPGGSCPSCGSTPFGRLVFRYLASSNLPYRNLRALAAIEDQRVGEELERMFELITVAPALIADRCGEPYDLLIADLGALEQDRRGEAAAAIGSSLGPSGVAIVSGEGCDGTAEAIRGGLEGAGCAVRATQLRSATVGFPAGGLLIARTAPRKPQPAGAG